MYCLRTNKTACINDLSIILFHKAFSGIKSDFVYAIGFNENLNNYCLNVTHNY